MFYVYILYSPSFDRFYIGQTEDIDNRLKRHNAGIELATRPYRPWNMIWFASKQTRSEAMILEKKLKNLNRLRLSAFIDKYS